jgi:hypothetical protein
MNDEVRPHVTDQGQQAGSIPDIDLMVPKLCERSLEALLVPSGVAGAAEEHGPLIVVNAVDVESAGIKEGTDL